jgi:hypothetical protein
MFGQRILPPPEDLPPRVRDAVAARTDSQLKLSEAQDELGNHKRTGIAAARRTDIEEHARAIEEGKPAPKRGQQEERALRKLDELQRSVEANSLVLERATERVDERIAEHQSAISHAAQKRLGDARRGFLSAVDDLDAAVAELVQASALAEWARDPSLSFRPRGAPVLVGLTTPAGDPLGVGAAIDAMRQVFEPRRPRGIPSPFTVPAPPAEPEPEIKPAEQSPNHSFAAELALGSGAPPD